MNNIIQNKKQQLNFLKNIHPYHLVKPSAWPFLLSVNIMYFFLIMVTYGIKHGKLVFTLNNILYNIILLLRNKLNFFFKIIFTFFMLPNSNKNNNIDIEKFLNNFNTLTPQEKEIYIKLLKYYYYKNLQNVNANKKISNTQESVITTNLKKEISPDILLEKIKFNVLDKEIREYNSFTTKELFYDFEGFLLQEYKLLDIPHRMSAKVNAAEYEMEEEYNRRYRHDVEEDPTFNAEEYEEDWGEDIIEDLVLERMRVLRRYFSQNETIDDLVANDLLDLQRYTWLYDVNLQSLLNSFKKYKPIHNFKDFFDNYSLFFDKILYHITKRLYEKSDITLENAKKTIFTLENRGSNSSSILWDKFIYSISYIWDGIFGGYTDMTIQNAKNTFRIPRSLPDIFYQVELLCDKIIYYSFLKSKNIDSIVTPILPEKDINNFIHGKVYTYLPATRTDGNNADLGKVVLVFDKNRWIDTISFSKYLKIMRNENALIHERELVTQRVAVYYSKYRYQELTHRMIYWMKNTLKYVKKTTEDFKSYPINIKYDNFDFHSNVYVIPQQIHWDYTFNLSNYVPFYEKLFFYITKYVSFWHAIHNEVTHVAYGYSSAIFFLLVYYFIIRLDFSNVSARKLYMLMMRIDIFFYKYFGRDLLTSQIEGSIITMIVFFLEMKYWLLELHRSNWHTLRWWRKRRSKLKRYDEFHFKSFKRLKGWYDYKSSSFYRQFNDFEYDENLTYFEYLIEKWKHKAKRMLKIDVSIDGDLKKKLAKKTIDTTSLNDSLNSKRKEVVMIIVNSSKGTTRHKLNEYYNTNFRIPGSLGLFTNLQYIIQKEFFLIKAYIQSFLLIFPKIASKISFFFDFLRRFVRMHYENVLNEHNYYFYFILTIPFRLLFLFEYIIRQIHSYILSRFIMHTASLKRDLFSIFTYIFDFFLYLNVQCFIFFNLCISSILWIWYIFYNFFITFFFKLISKNFFIIISSILQEYFSLTTALCMKIFLSLVYIFDWISYFYNKFNFYLIEINRYDYLKFFVHLYNLLQDFLSNRFNFFFLNKNVENSELVTVLKTPIKKIKFKVNFKYNKNFYLKKNYNFNLYQKFSNLLNIHEKNLKKKFINDSLSTQLSILDGTHDLINNKKKRQKILNYLRKQNKYNIFIDKDSLYKQFNERKEFLWNIYQNNVKRKDHIDVLWNNFLTEDFWKYGNIFKIFRKSYEAILPGLKFFRSKGKTTESVERSSEHLIKYYVIKPWVLKIYFNALNRIKHYNRINRKKYLMQLNDIKSKQMLSNDYLKKTIKTKYSYNYSFFFKNEWFLKLKENMNIYFLKGLEKYTFLKLEYFYRISNNFFFLDKARYLFKRPAYWNRLFLNKVHELLIRPYPWNRFFLKEKPTTEAISKILQKYAILPPKWEIGSMFRRKKFMAHSLKKYVKTNYYNKELIRLYNDAKFLGVNKRRGDMRNLIYKKYFLNSYPLNNFKRNRLISNINLNYLSRDEIQNLLKFLKQNNITFSKTNLNKNLNNDKKFIIIENFEQELFTGYIASFRYTKISPSEILNTIYFKKNQNIAFNWYLQNIIWKKENILINDFFFKEYLENNTFNQPVFYDMYQNRAYNIKNINYDNLKHKYFSYKNRLYSIKDLINLEHYFQKNDVAISCIYVKHLLMKYYNLDINFQISPNDSNSLIYFYNKIFTKLKNMFILEFWKYPHIIDVKTSNNLFKKKFWNYNLMHFSTDSKNKWYWINFEKFKTTFVKNWTLHSYINFKSKNFYSYYNNVWKSYIEMLDVSNHFFERNLITNKLQLKKYILNNILYLENELLTNRLETITKTDVDYLKFLNSSFWNFDYSLGNFNNNYIFIPKFKINDINALFLVFSKNNSACLHLPFFFDGNNYSFSFNDVTTNKLIFIWLKTLYQYVEQPQDDLNVRYFQQVSILIDNFFPLILKISNFLEDLGDIIDNFFFNFIIYNSIDKKLYWNFFNFNFLDTFNFIFDFSKILIFIKFQYNLYLENFKIDSKPSSLDIFFFIKYFFILLKDFLINNILNYIEISFFNLLEYFWKICLNIFTHISIIFFTILNNISEITIGLWFPIFSFFTFFKSFFSSLVLKLCYSHLLFFYTILEQFFIFRHKVITEFDNKFFGNVGKPFNLLKSLKLNFNKDAEIENTRLDFYSKQVLKLYKQKLVSYQLPLKQQKKTSIVNVYHPISSEEEILENISIRNNIQRNLNLEKVYQQRYTLKAIINIEKAKENLKNKKNMLDNKYVFPELKDLKYKTWYVLKDYYFEIKILNIFFVIRDKFFLIFDFFKWLYLSIFMDKLIESLVLWVSEKHQNIYFFFFTFSFKDSLDTILTKVIHFLFEFITDFNIYRKYFLHYWIINGWSWKHFSLKFLYDFILYRIFFINPNYWKDEYLRDIYIEDDWIFSVLMFKKLEKLNSHFLETCIPIWEDYYIYWNTVSPINVNRNYINFYFLFLEFKKDFLNYYWNFTEIYYKNNYPELYLKFLNRTITKEELIYILEIRFLSFPSFLYQFISDSIFFLYNGFINTINEPWMFSKYIHFYSRYKENKADIKLECWINFVHFIYNSAYVFMFYLLKVLEYIDYDEKMAIFHKKAWYWLSWYALELNARFGYHINVTRLYAGAYFIIDFFHKISYEDFMYLYKNNVTFTNFIKFWTKEFLTLWYIDLFVTLAVHVSIISLDTFIFWYFRNYLVKHYCNFIFSTKNFFQDWKNDILEKKDLIKKIFTLPKNLYEFSGFCNNPIINFPMIFYKICVGFLKLIYLNAFWTFESIYKGIMFILKIFIKCNILINKISKNFWILILHIIEFFVLTLPKNVILGSQFLYGLFQILYGFIIAMWGEICYLIIQICYIFSQKIFWLNKWLDLFYSITTFFSSFFNIFFSILKMFITFDLNMFLINFHMYFIKFWSFFSDDKWYNSYTLLWIFELFQPLRQWLRHHFRSGKTVEIFISGDINRSLPIILSDDPRLLDIRKRVLTMEYFRRQELDRAFAYQTRSLWHTAWYINKYIEMMNQIDIPDIIKQSYYKIYTMRMYNQAVYAFLESFKSGRTPKHSLDEINEFFIEIIKQTDGSNVFKIEDLKKLFYQTNLITKRNYLTYLVDNDKETYEWLASLFNLDFIDRDSETDETVRGDEYAQWVRHAVQGHTKLEFVDIEAEDEGDDFHEDYCNAIDKWEDELVFNQINNRFFWRVSGLGNSMLKDIDRVLLEETERKKAVRHLLKYSRHRDYDSVLYFSYLLKDALDVYDFMVFNQKIYNFYLDMFGPEFAKIYYHFPGQSLYLINNNISLEENIRFLLDFLKTNPSVLSPTSVINRLHDKDFSIHYRGLENMSFYNDYFLHGWLLERSSTFPFYEKYQLGFQSRFDETGNPINRIQKPLYRALDFHFQNTIAKMFHVSDNREHANLRSVKTKGNAANGLAFEKIVRSSNFGSTFNTVKGSRVIPKIGIQVRLPFNFLYETSFSFWGKVPYQWTLRWNKYFQAKKAYLELYWRLHRSTVTKLEKEYLTDVNDKTGVYPFRRSKRGILAQHLGFWDWGIMVYKRNIQFKKFLNRHLTYWQQLNIDDKRWLASFYNTYLNITLLPYDYARIRSLKELRAYFKEVSTDVYVNEKELDDEQHYPFTQLLKYRTYAPDYYGEQPNPRNENILAIDRKNSVFTELSRIMKKMPIKWKFRFDKDLYRRVKYSLNPSEYKYNTTLPPFQKRKLKIIKEHNLALRATYQKYIEKILFKKVVNYVEKHTKFAGNSNRPSVWSDKFLNWAMAVDSALQYIEKKYSPETAQTILEKLFSNNYTPKLTPGRAYKRKLELVIFNKRRFFPKKVTDYTYLSEYDNESARDINHFALRYGTSVDAIMDVHPYLNIIEIFRALANHRPYTIMTPYINIEEYFKLINIRMNMRPHCYKYWVFYDDLDIAAKFYNTINFDAPNDLQISFQDPASPIMEGIIDLHHDLVFFMLLISISICIVLINIVYWNFTRRAKSIIEYQFNHWRWNLYIFVKPWHYLLTQLKLFLIEEKIKQPKILKRLLDILRHGLSYCYKNGLPNWKYLEYIGWRFKRFAVRYFNWGTLVGDELLNLFILKNSKVQKDIIEYLRTIVLIRRIQLNIMKNIYITPLYKRNIPPYVRKYLPKFKKFHKFLVKHKIVENIPIVPNEPEYNRLWYVVGNKTSAWFPNLFSHHTMIEIIWTLIPAFILILIALPSFSLLFSMDQIWQPSFTIKVIGNQWYWSYEYC